MTSREFLTRRSFMRRAAGATMGLGAMNQLFDLRLIGNAMADVDVSDYKALVCVFLSGGNDMNNMLIPAPTDSRYAGYKSIRGERLALWEDAAAAAARANATTNPNAYYALPLSNAHTTGDYAVHSAMPAVQNLFNQGKLAFQSGVGVLVEPITRAQYLAGSKKKPPQLFSHNDQVTQWQTSLPDQISRTGWGGRTIDKMREELASSNSPPGSVSMSVSLSGSNTWEVGDVVNQFQVSTSGTVSFSNYSGARKTLMDQILRDPALGGDAQLAAERANLHLKDFQRINEQSLFNSASLSTAFTRLNTGQVDAALGAAIDAAFGVTGVAPNRYSDLSGLEQQLHSIARIIAERTYLGMQRQIFFCSNGGHDTHGDQPLAHNNLMATLSRALGKFYDATAALGISDKVTSFTGSDFGRTFKSNGLGSDHAWSSHHIVMGGAVQGGRVFGTFPQLVLGGPDDTDSGSSPTGRWIPTTSVDEFAATLGRWFGLGDAELDSVFPNLGRFASRNLGFMA